MLLLWQQHENSRIALAESSRSVKHILVQERKYSVSGIDQDLNFEFEFELEFEFVQGGEGEAERVGGVVESGEPARVAAGRGADEAVPKGAAAHRPEEALPRTAHHPRTLCAGIKPFISISPSPSQ